MLENGILPQAIRASGAFPSLFDLVEIDGKLLTDGGIADNYPVKEVKDKGMDIIIGVDVQDPLTKRKDINSVVSILSQVTTFPIISNLILRGLTLSRLTKGKQSLKMEKLQLRSFYRDCERLLPNNDTTEWKTPS